jgi:crotonobetainyl-CoA:carnitine CoA-transferase CaiB-like acyl-CoA transferase
MPAFELSLTPAADPLPDPCLCEHTEMVLKKLLGLSDKEIEALEAQGAVELESAVTAAGNH